MTERTPESLRNAIEELIDAGTSADLNGLDRIYHQDMHILMLNEEGEVNRFDKPSFITMLKQTMDGSNPDDHKWARFDAVDVDGDSGHVLITRKVRLGGDHKILTLSIDLTHEEGRWQVTREVIFVRSKPDGAPH